MVFHDPMISKMYLDLLFPPLLSSKLLVVLNVEDHYSYWIVSFIFWVALVFSFHIFCVSLLHQSKDKNTKNLKESQEFLGG